MAKSSGAPKFDVVLRRAVNADVQRIEVLRGEFLQTQIDAGLLDVPSNVPESLASTTHAMVSGKRRYAFVAECEGVIEGYLLALVRIVPGMVVSAVGSIEEIYVSPIIEGTGAARRLVAQAIASLKVDGVGRVQTRVLAGNVAARAFWRRLGFEDNIHILEFYEI